MSVYRDTNASVVFEHPHAGPLTASVYRDGGTTPILTASNIAKTDSLGVPSASGAFRLPLTWVETAYDGKLSIKWTATGFERTQRVEVVTPLVSLTRLRTLFEGENKSNEELTELENTVRIFIEAYCRQKFGFFTGARTFIGTGGKTISLDQRINKITTFSGGWPGYLKVSSDGWTLTVVPENLLDLKQAPPEELLTGQTVYVGGVIRVPEQYIRRFNTGTTYTVTGEWGWETVPDEVQEAAMLLANDFACNEVLYRDRYLESVKIQQDTVVYSPGAFRGTGNARADLLLTKFKRSGMVII